MSTSDSDLQESQKSAADLLEKLFTCGPESWKAHKDPGGQLRCDIGAINRITLPKDWVQGLVRRNLLGHSFYEEYTAAGAPEVRLFFFYAGATVEASVAAAVKESLAQPSHVLSQKEASQLSPLLRARHGPAFVRQAFQTEDLNGRMVLLLTGSYTEDNKNMICMFIPCDEAASVILELEFQAPADKFANFRNAAVRSIKSICWK